MTKEEAFDLGKKAGAQEIIELLVSALNIEHMIQDAIARHEAQQHGIEE